MTTPTADLCDAHPDVELASPLFRDYGGVECFGGQIVTLKLFEDNSLVREALSTPGKGRVLVVDGGGSTRCALLGDRLATLAVENGWAGVVLNGCLRDAAVVAGIALGVKALATCPRKSIKRGLGEKDVPVRFAGLWFRPGDWVYADRDGLILAGRELTPPESP